MAFRLENRVQPYAWGSHTAIARLQGRSTPSSAPEAELWMGAHPLAPSVLPDGERLDAFVRRDPGHALGAQVQARFGDRLPFLLKVLAAETPLSLQAHPSEARAQEGFAREEAAGIPRDAPHRNYKDPHHKPELLVALEPFAALCGFRAIPELLALFTTIGVPEVVAPLAARPDADGLAATFRAVVADPRHVPAVLAGCARHDGGPFAPGLRWAERIAALYPGDPGIVVSLLLEVLELAPGQGVFLPAGNLHAYLSGVGIEIMASSDNVLRGGLTPKHVDVPELLATLDFSAPRTRPLSPPDARETVWDTRAGAREFLLSRVHVTPDTPFATAVTGPEILLCTEGEARIRSGVPGATEPIRTVALPRGAAAFVPDSDGDYVLEGEASVFRARVPLDDALS